MADKNIRIRLGMEGGKIVEAELANIGTKGSAALNKVTAATTAASGGMGRMGGAVGNAANQITDIIVQAEMGTDIFRIMGQQLPQLLVGFGAFGAVVGVAAAALGPLLRMMFDGQDPIKALTEDLKALEQAMGALRSAQEAAGADVMDLVGKYGQLTPAAQKLLENQREVAELVARRSFAAAANSASEVFGGGLTGVPVAEIETSYAALRKLREEAAGIAKEFENANNWFLPPEALNNLSMRAGLNVQAMRELGDYVYAMEELAATYNISEDAAMGLAIAAAKVREADSTAEQVSAVRALAEAIYQSTDGLTNASDEAIDLYTSLTNSLESGLALQAIDIASGIGDGADQAERLKANMADAANAWLAARSLAQQPGNLALAKYGNRGTVDTRPIEDGQGNVIRFDRNKGGGGAAKLSDDARAAKALFESTRTTAERYAAEQENIRRLMESGAISTDTYTRAMAQLNEKYAGGVSATKFWEDQNKALRESILDLAVDGENTFDRITSAIKRAAFEAALFGSGPLNGMFGGGLLSGLFGGGGGGGTGAMGLPLPFAKGGAFDAGGQVTAFARGGVVSGPTVFPFARGIGLMGEAGPEAIMPLSRGRDGRLGVQMQQSAGGAPMVLNISLTVNAQGASAGQGQELGQRILAELEPQIEQIALRAVRNASSRGK